MGKSTKSKMGDILPDEREKPLKYKICVLGGGGVGKSCLTFRLINDQFLSKYDPTIEDSYMKEGFNVDGEEYTVEILDTAGQDTCIRRDVYYKDYHGFVLVYSVDQKSSLDDVREKFASHISSRGCTLKESPPVIVVGNKCDLEGAQRVVTKEEGQALAAELGQNEGLVSFAESSAKSNINVYEVFADVIRRRKVQREATGQKKKGDKEKKKCNIL